MEHLLIGQLYFAKVLPPRVVVQPYMRDDEAFIVRVLRLGFVIHTHNPPDELDVSGQTAKRAENGGHAQPWMVKPFAQHLHLHNTVETVVP